MVNLTQVLTNWLEPIRQTLENWGFVGLDKIVVEYTPKANWISQMLMGIFEWLGNYGWTIILFTLLLRVLTLPLDFWQKFSMKKNSKIMGEITPIMQKIDKAYANNPQAANAEKQKLMKKYRYNPMASCLPTIVTMVVFIIMFQGLNNCSSTLNIQVYQKLQQEYLTAYHQVIANDSMIETDILNKNGQKTTYMYYALNKGEFNGQDKTTLDEGYRQITQKAQKQARIAALNAFEDNRQGFLWIKSLWRSDNWQKVMPKTYNEFTGTLSGNSNTDGLTTDTIYADIYKAFENPEICFDMQNSVEAEQCKAIKKQLGYGTGMWNGLLILPLLAIGLSFLTTKMSNKMQGNMGTGAQAEQAQSQQKTMSFIMPIMMGVFALFYSAAFALYMVASNIFNILFNFAETPIINKMVDKRKSVVQSDASYKR